MLAEHLLREYIREDVEWGPTAVATDHVNVWYGRNQALKNINLQIPAKRITAFIGPSGCGKTTLLRSINRMNDLIPRFRLNGSIHLGSEDIYNEKYPVAQLRRKVGMVFQEANPFPRSIYDNLKLPLLENYAHLRPAAVRRIVIDKLRDVGLYDEIKQRLAESAFRLSGGQPQRSCLARALTIEPEILLLDEPCSALDPISTSKIESLLRRLKEKYTIVIVTHNLQQAARIADYVVFFYQGEIVESGSAADFFINPREKLTANYLRGAF